MKHYHMIDQKRTADRFSVHYKLDKEDIVSCIVCAVIILVMLVTATN